MMIQNDDHDDRFCSKVVDLRTQSKTVAEEPRPTYWDLPELQIVPTATQVPLESEKVAEIFPDFDLDDLPTLPINPTGIANG